MLKKASINISKIKSFLVDFLKTSWRSPFIAIAMNLLLVYLCYFICRVAFYLENLDQFSQDMDFASFVNIFKGGLLFDTSAICYTNAIYLALILFPLHIKEKKWYYGIVKWYYVLVNSLCIIINLADAAFYAYRLNRTTAMFFQEFGNENNIGSLVLPELISHWYLVLLAALMIFGLIKLYRKPDKYDVLYPKKYYYGLRVLSLLMIVPLLLCGMRGALFTTATRPIAIGNAHQYVTNPSQAALVLNTTFTIIRTLTKRPMKSPHYFATPEALDSVYSPVHYPRPDAVMNKKNVVILIVESFATEFIGEFNKDLDGGTYKGYTPFADSLIRQSLTYKETFCNTGFSIDAMPAILASIPRMGDPFVLTPFAVNEVTSVATELGKKDYYSAFFHGASNESMGFQAFARQAGFKDYFGMDEYCEDTRFGGMNDFDGKWAIWDEEFLQYFCLKMSEFPQPFVAGVFTATSHHPFHIPDKYKDRFPDEGKYPIHKCIRYTDYSLRRFFETASRQPWYQNTIFVITADHASSKRTHDVYNTEVGHFRAPVIFFDPSGDMPRGIHDGIAQQTDILPTLLDYLDYDLPYVAFGQPLLSTPADETWAFNWDHIPQYIMGDYAMEFDGEKVLALYNYKADPMCRNNLKGKSPVEADMLTRVKAFMQSLLQRANDKAFVYKEEK